MCGIAGIITSGNNAWPHEDTRRTLLKMAACLQHRGPDNEGIWINETGSSGLAHRRLSIIDLTESGNQPMVCLGRYTIVHNGEIYNYIELREELEKAGYQFRSGSDTEVIATAFDLWEDECVEHFDGMFAFAIWDEEDQSLFAARDRFGEKPFYYHYDQSGLVFASEIKAFWSAGFQRQPNLKMLFNFITIGYTDNPADPNETFFEGISRLPAASTLRYYPSLHDLSLSKYWEIDVTEPNTSISDNEAIEKFGHLLTDSVKRRLRSDVPVGASVSGGLDSSSIVSIIKKIDPTSKLSAFTAHFPGFEKDELSYARDLCRQLEVDHYTTSFTADDFIRDWNKLVACQEEPFGSASIYAQYKVFELAKQQGIKVLLDGQGADETLAGYHKYYKWYWQELFMRRKLITSRELKMAKANGVREDFGFRNIIAALFPDMATVVLERQYLLKALRQEGLDPEFVKFQSKEAYYTTPDVHSLNGALHFNTCVHGLEELLRYADRNAMAHGRELRLPFLSHELVEFVFSLPSRFKIRQGWTKWILRQSMQNDLPRSIAWRKDKTGFEPPQRSWMEDARVQDLILEAKKILVREKILDQRVLSRPVIPKSSHDADNFDWRYLTAAMLFLK
jgi:asparagine synthase (glutamine-hydrolysing)